MTNEITMNAPVAKRADILFEIGEAEKRIARLQTELVHLDAVLRMLRSDFKAEGLPVRHRRPTKSPYFRRGELTQRIFNAMRENGSVTSFEVARRSDARQGARSRERQAYANRLRASGRARASATCPGRAKSIRSVAVAQCSGN